MNLSDKTILKEIENGNIVIEPFNINHLNPNSVDLTLNKFYKTVVKDNLLTVYERTEMYALRMGYTPQQIDEMFFHYSDYEMHDVLDTANIPRYYLDCKQQNHFIEKEMPEDGLILMPGELYIYSCNEKIGNKNNICSTVMGKSSLGRLGLDIHICAGFVDTGFVGSLVLEMRVIHPLKVYPNQKICQIKFERVEGEFNQTYDQKPESKYMNQVGAQESLMNKNFK